MSPIWTDSMLIYRAKVKAAVISRHFERYPRISEAQPGLLQYASVSCCRKS